MKVLSLMSTLLSFQELQNLCVMSVAPTSMLSIERAKASLRDIITALSLPDHATRLTEAKNNAGNDMMMYMQLVFPLATQIQQDVIQNYGFPADREGLLEFTRLIKILAKENEEIAQMDEDLRSLLIPPMVLPYPQTTAN